MKFTHIYVEEKVKNHPVTRKLLENFPKAEVIGIGHYKDVFNRKHQNFIAQKKQQALILAKKEGCLVYEGAPMCQNFGHSWFYYTSCMMNCIFDCEYCYLQGMYPSGHAVLFVNIEDIFEEVKMLLKKHPVYLCVSYDTDLLAVEKLTGLVRQWCAFAKDESDLTVEVRTKSAAYFAIKDIAPPQNVILAWTMSPEAVIEKYEHYTAALESRIQAAAQAAKDGWRIRLCLEPVLYSAQWKEMYGDFMAYLFSRIEGRSVMDVSLGEFRVSAPYLKLMRRQRPKSEVLFYPYTVEDGVCRYDSALSCEMMTFMKNRLLEYVKEEQIYVWSENDGK